MKVWRLKKGADRRIRHGHPWVFAGEVSHSTKEVEPGEVVELRDSQDHFLAFGYAHPHSQIAFRKLSANAKEADVLSVEFFRRRLKTAREFRRLAGWTDTSHRWLYAEGDGVPGLVVDAFKSDESWIVVVQASTAGMDRALHNICEAIVTFQAELGGKLHVVEAPSAQARRQEGLAISPKKLVFGETLDLQNITLHLKENLRLTCDLLNGQKTGFFLDQQHNAVLLKRILENFSPERPLKVLDICCYVGQWGAHAIRAVARQDLAVTLVDASESALKLATQNIENCGARAHSICGDALEILAQLEPNAFDVVICDPPAFVKKKADLEAGLRAYTKLNRDAMKLAVPGAVMVASSCSGLVKRADWQSVLADASIKAGRAFKTFVSGGHGPDHPLRPEFPEGEYLKCEIGLLERPW